MILIYYRHIAITSSTVEPFDWYRHLAVKELLPIEPHEWDLLVYLDRSLIRLIKTVVGCDIQSDFTTFASETLRSQFIPSTLPSQSGLSLLMCRLFHSYCIFDRSNRHPARTMSRLHTLYSSLLTWLETRYSQPKDSTFDGDVDPIHTARLRLLIQCASKVGFELNNTGISSFTREDFELLVASSRHDDVPHDDSGRPWRCEISDLVAFGIVQPVQPATVDDVCESYAFIHGSVQDFFASKWIVEELQSKSTERSADMSKWIFDHRNVQRFDVMWWFVSGECREREVTPTLTNHLASLFRPESSDSGGPWWLSLWSHLAEEGRWYDLVDEQVDVPNIQFILSVLYRHVETSFFKDRPDPWLISFVQTCPAGRNYPILLNPSLVEQLAKWVDGRSAQDSICATTILCEISAYIIQDPVCWGKVSEVKIPSSSRSFFILNILKQSGRLLLTKPDFVDKLLTSLNAPSIDVSKAVLDCLIGIGSALMMDRRYAKAIQDLIKIKKNLKNTTLKWHFKLLDHHRPLILTHPLWIKWLQISFNHQLNWISNTSLKDFFQTGLYHALFHREWIPFLQLASINFDSNYCADMIQLSALYLPTLNGLNFFSTRYSQFKLPNGEYIVNSRMVLIWKELTLHSQVIVSHPDWGSWLRTGILASDPFYSLNALNVLISGCQSFMLSDRDWRPLIQGLSRDSRSWMRLVAWTLLIR